jgi:hypothetical protein
MKHSDLPLLFEGHFFFVRSCSIWAGTTVPGRAKA